MRNQAECAHWEFGMGILTYNWCHPYGPPGKSEFTGRRIVSQSESKPSVPFHRVRIKGLPR
jgi:hypothetical protein